MESDARELKPTEAALQNTIGDHFTRTGSICIPNCGAFGWECDVLRLTSRWLCAEYEVKVSRADFRADKGKVWKHIRLANPEAGNQRPNYFWYVAPPGVIPVAELPEYAGLLEVDGGEINVVRRAPRLHREPMSPRIATYAMRGMTIRYWQQRSLSKEQRA